MAGRREARVVGQPGQADPPAIEGAFQRTPAGRAVAAAGPVPGTVPALIAVSTSTGSQISSKAPSAGSPGSAR